eukprot:3932483-Rhodomonas_salina.1
MGMGTLAATVSRCRHLERLAVNHVRARRSYAAGDAGHMIAAVLAACKSLKVVEASSNQIYDEGATSITAILNGCPALEGINLQHNHIRRDGALAFRG